MTKIKKITIKQILKYIYYSSRKLAPSKRVQHAFPSEEKQFSLFVIFLFPICDILSFFFLYFLSCRSCFPRFLTPSFLALFAIALQSQKHLLADLQDFGLDFFRKTFQTSHLRGKKLFFVFFNFLFSQRLNKNDETSFELEI